MPRQMYRTQRQAAFTEAAARMYTALEDWYEQHPDASFGQIETEARRRRRELMGQALGILINGQDSGYQLAPPSCPQCGRMMSFEGYRSCASA